VKARLNRLERKAQTRETLVAVALQVFLERGFHAASLADIAAAAGFTTGAVYSNFSDKDELFVAVLDAEFARRAPLHERALSDAQSFEEYVRSSARDHESFASEHPSWTGVYVEFWTHASQRPALRRRMATRYERLVAAVAEQIERAAKQFGLELVISSESAARGFFALTRGLGLERLLNQTGLTTADLETMMFAYAKGLVRTRSEQGTNSVTLSDEAAPSGRPYRCIAKIDGRSDDMLRMQGPGGLVAVHPFRLRAPFASLSAVRCYQITHNPWGLDVQVVLRSDAAPDTTTRIRDSLLRAIAEAGANAVALTVTPVDEIKRDSGSGGKLKSIVNNVPRGAA
jgi:AcrR family transcriptional regulator